MEARGDSALSRKKGRAPEKYQIAPRAGIRYNRLRRRKREIQAWEDVPGMKIINFSVNRKRMAGTPRDRVVEGGGKLVFAWGVENAPGQKQAAYQLTLACDGSDIYDSGWVETDAQECAVSGLAVPSGARVDAALTVRDDTGAESEKGIQSFYPVNVEWTAKWMTAPEDTNLRTVYFRREFSVKGEVRRAVLYACGLGYQNLYINGVRVDDARLDPAHTDYSVVCQYVAVPDAGDFLRAGENCLAAEVGGGWRDNPGGYQEHVADVTFFGDRRLIYMLDIAYADGSAERLVSDEGTQAGFGPSVRSTLFNGEDYDATLSIPGWNEVGFAGFKAAKVCETDVGALRPMVIPPIREVETVKPLSVSRHDGSYIVDFGLNLAGVVRVKLPKMPRGTVVSLSHAEELDETGDLYTATLRGAEATDRYTCAGDASDLDVWQPDFTYHGFRYARVTGVDVGRDDVEAVFLRTDMKRNGFFVSGSAALNALQQQVLRTEEGNMHSILTDCPQRDERMGWMNDATVRFEETPYNFDCAGMFRKIVRDLISIQKPDGAIACTAPKVFGAFPADPVCSSFLVAGLQAYLHFADKETLEEAFDAFAAWEGCLLDHSEDYIVNYSYYGDWAGPAYACEPNDGARSIVTPGVFMSTGYSFFNCRTLAEMAEALGREGDARKYRALAGRVREAMLRKWYDAADAVFATGSMACQAFSLWLGIVPEEDRARAAKKLRGDLVSAGYAFTTGNLCTRYLLDELAEFGYVDDAYELLTRDEYPSWGFMRQNEATTVWERFELKKNPGMNSHNHPMYGSVGAFLYTGLLGLAPTQPGFRRFSVKPRMPEKLLSAQGGVDSPYGAIHVRWFKRYGGCHLFVDVPFGCTCDVEFMGQKRTLQAGAHHLNVAE